MTAATATAPPVDLLAAAAIAVDDERFDVADVVLLALADGSWQRLGAHLGRGLALERSHGSSVAPERVAAEVTAFRYERGLVAGADVRAWLADRGVALADVRRHRLRALLLEEHGADGERDAADVGQVLREALVSGLLGRAAARLGDVAVLGGAEPHAGVQPGDVAALEGAAASAGLEVEDVGRRAHRILALLAAEAAFVRRTATPEAVSRCLATHALDWLRADGAELVLPSEGAALEAVLCLRADRTGPDALAAWLGVPLRRWRRSVVDVEGVAPGVLASVPLGEPVDPVPLDGGGWAVVVVERRTAPEAGDPELARRAADEVVRVAVDRLRAGRVRELAAL